MKAICVVQARTNSSRLPGKVLLPLNGHTVIGEVLSRCWKISGISQVVCTTPTNDEELGREATKYAPVTTGPEHDVLHRYYSAAYVYRADIVMRVTGDCPLISPELCGAVLAKLVAENADYGSNIDPRTFPQGMDCEVFTWKLLERAEHEAADSEREHVTTWMRGQPIKRVNVASPWKMEGRLTLDTETDYHSICAYYGCEPGQRLHAA